VNESLHKHPVGIRFKPHKPWNIRAVAWAEWLNARPKPVRGNGWQSWLDTDLESPDRAQWILWNCKTGMTFIGRMD